MSATTNERTTLRSLYRTMCRIDAFEERAERAFADGLIVGALHVSIGQEAVAAGVCAHLTDADLITSTHRGAITPADRPAAIVAAPVLRKPRRFWLPASCGISFRFIFPVREK
jgi:hypothetical protein